MIVSLVISHLKCVVDSFTFLIIIIIIVLILIVVDQCCLWRGPKGRQVRDQTTEPALTSPIRPHSHLQSAPTPRLLQLELKRVAAHRGWLRLLLRARIGRGGRPAFGPGLLRHPAWGARHARAVCWRLRVRWARLCWVAGPTGEQGLTGSRAVAWLLQPARRARQNLGPRTRPGARPPVPSTAPDALRDPFPEDHVCSRMRLDWTIHFHRGSTTARARTAAGLAGTGRRRLQWLR